MLGCVHKGDDSVANVDRTNQLGISNSFTVVCGKNEELSLTSREFSLVFGTKVK